MKNIKYLLISIFNLIAGVYFLSTIKPDTPSVVIVFIVAGILMIFGFWGLTLWFKFLAQKHCDAVVNVEPMENWWKTVRAFDLILVIGLFSRLFIIQPFVVDGPSMEPNFQNNEAILLDKLSFHWRTPARGEVIIFKAPPQPAEDYIKRIIGLPGENVTIEKSEIYINGRLLHEVYLPQGSGLGPNEYYQKTLGPDEYFVMGDNRPRSSDSRNWGTVPKENLIGHAVMAIYPLDQFGIIKNPKLNL